MKSRSAGRSVMVACGLLAWTAAAEWKVPNWCPIVTEQGAVKEWIGKTWSGHVQGMCVSSNALYFSFHDQIVKTDWYGRFQKRVEVDVHGGDICYWNGKLYTAVCIPKDVPKRGRIDVWDENLKKVGTTEFVRSADGIACMDGVLYVDKMLEDVSDRYHKVSPREQNGGEAQ